MSKRITLLLIIFALVAFMVGAQWVSSSSSAKLQVNPSLFTSDGGSRKSMFEELEGKARLAQDDNETAISALADSIFNEVGSPAIPANVITRIKERLVRAEKNFRKNKKGVREASIVRMINELADKFQAPAYAKTSPLQVRIARVELMKYMPSFIAQETRAERKGLKKKVGASINPEVSPLEAAYIAMLLIHQKMLNEEYQQTPDEYAANLHRWRAAERNNSSATEHTIVNKRNQEKCREMRQVVSGGVARLSPASIQGLIDDSLDTLGIER
jgi:hypothetical protein